MAAAVEDVRDGEVSAFLFLPSSSFSGHPDRERGGLRGDACFLILDPDKQEMGSAFREMRKTMSSSRGSG